MQKGLDVLYPEETLKISQPQAMVTVSYCVYLLLKVDYELYPTRQKVTEVGDVQLLKSILTKDVSQLVLYGFYDPEKATTEDELELRSTPVQVQQDESSHLNIGQSK